MTLGAAAPPATPCLVVVEDDIDVRETLTEVLTEEGYQVLAFASGKAALAHLKGMPVPPTLILLDLMMPNMDGYEFRKEQRRDASASHVPTVILSGDGNVEQNMKELAADGYLRKPIHIKALLQLVERFCGPPGQTERPEQGLIP